MMSSTVLAQITPAAAFPAPTVEFLFFLVFLVLGTRRVRLFRGFVLNHLVPLVISLPAAGQGGLHLLGDFGGDTLTMAPIRTAVPS